MPGYRGWSLILAASTLAACDAGSGDDARGRMAGGQARDGDVTVNAPGLQLSVNLPEPFRREAHLDPGDNNHLVYPGSQLGGVAVQAGDGESGNAGASHVELRFSSADAPDRVAAWYADPARRAHFTVSGTRRDGASTIVEGNDKSGARFRVTLGPAAGGHTEGRLLIIDRS